MMNTRTESTILFTNCTAEEQIFNCYRLIRTVDAFLGDDVFSVFVTTKTDDGLDEEFVYDITRDEQVAKDFFSRLCHERVTACTLQDITKDFLADF
jgi:hypothetical protein